MSMDNDEKKFYEPTSDLGKLLRVLFQEHGGMNSLAFLEIDVENALKQADTLSDGKAMGITLGRRGGLKGGKARAAKMSDKERSDSAKKASQARWQHKLKNPQTKND